METLSWNLTALSLYGFDYGQDVLHCKVQDQSCSVKSTDRHKKCSFIRRILRKCYHILLLSIIVVGGVFLTSFIALTAETMDYKILNIIMTSWFMCFILMYIRSEKYLPEVLKTIVSIIPNLDAKEIKRIKRLDRRDIIQRFLLLLSSGIEMSISLFYFGEEVPTFVLSMYSNDIQMFVHFAAVSLTLGMGLQYFQFYVIVTEVAKVYAENCRNEILRETKFQLIQKTLDDFRLFVRNINQRLEMIPAMMFAVLFLDFVIIVTLVTLYSDELTFDSGFLAFELTFGYQFIIIYQVISRASKMSETIEEAVEDVASRITTALPENTRTEEQEARTCLSLYLQHKPIPSLTVGSNYKLNFTTLLSFNFSLIPFTIMIITTISGVLKDRFSSMEEKLNCTSV